LWAAGSVFLLWLQNRKGAGRPVPATTTRWWVLLIALFGARAAFSDSVAYSVSWMVRLVAAYAVYGFFFRLSTPELLRKFSSTIVVLAAGAAAVSMVFIVVPPVYFMPLMNVLYSTYGHSHLADFLLFVLPIAVFVVIEKQNQRTQTTLGVLLVGFFLTFARGAWMLFGLFFLIVLLRRPPKEKRALLLPSAAAAGVALVGLMVLQVFSSTPWGRQLPGWISRQTKKPPIVSDVRIGYWKQAVDAIGERPWFGSGPGTFYLQSRRLQEAPNSYSWFAHSFPLEQFVEVGVVGAIPLLLFVIASMWWIYKKTSRDSAHGPLCRPLWWGAVLVLAQSLFDFNLNYLYLWLLLWATLGILSGATRKIESNERRKLRWTRVFHWGLVGFLFFYYGSWIVSKLFISAGNNSTKAFLVAPYQRETTLAFLAKQKAAGSQLSSVEKNLIMYFYQKDPDALLATAPLLDVPTAVRLYTTSFALDPNPPDILQRHRAYLEFLIEHNKPEKIGPELRALVRASLPSFFAEQSDSIPLDDLSLVFSYRKETIGLLYSTLNRQSGFSKLFYFIGLEVVDKHPVLTKRLWTLARDFSPQWSYFHIELASLENHIFQSNQGSLEALGVCMDHVDAGPHCSRYLKFSLPMPGYFKKDIFSII
jgi:O-antigen ligase